MPQVPCELAQIVKCNGSATRPCDGLQMAARIPGQRKQGDEPYLVARSEARLDNFMESRPCPKPARGVLRRAASAH